MARYTPLPVNPTERYTPAPPSIPGTAEDSFATAAPDRYKPLDDEPLPEPLPESPMNRYEPLPVGTTEVTPEQMADQMKKHGFKQANITVAVDALQRIPGAEMIIKPNLTEREQGVIRAPTAADKSYEPARDPLDWASKKAKSAAGNVFEFGKGLAGPAVGAGKFGFSVLDWLASGIQHEFNPDVKPNPDPFAEAWTGIGKTLQGHPTDLLGGSARGVREEGLGYLATPRGAGEAVADIATNLTLLPILGRGAAAAKSTLPVRTQTAIDRGIGKVIPKWNWTDEMVYMEAALEGSKMAAAGGTRISANIRKPFNDIFLNELMGMRANDGRPLATFGQPGDYVPLVGAESPYATAARAAKHPIHVHPDIVDMAYSLKAPVQSVDTLRQFLQAWKASKTIWSPNTHVNNTLGDLMFSHLAGNNPANPMNARYYSQALRDLREGVPGPALTEAMENGAVRPGLIEHELRQPSAHPVFRALTDSPAAQKMGRAYDLEDQVFRYATYLKLRAGGATPMAASAEVNKYFPSYSSTSAVGRELRGQGSRLGAVVGSPFTSFGFEAARIYATAAREHPLRLATLGVLPSMATVMNLQDAGMTLQDWQDVRGRMPSYMRDRPLIPFKNPATGALEVADLSNVIPLSSVTNRGDSLAETGPGRDFLLGGPGWNAFKIGINQDWGMNRKIVDPLKGEDWTHEGLQAIGRGVLPIPSAAINLTDRVPKAIDGRPPRRNAPEPESIPAAVWHSIFGSMDAKTVEELEKSGKGERKAIEAEGKRGKRSIQRDPTIDEQTRERRKLNLKEYLQERKGR